MEQRDLLKEQIEQMARVLGKIFADFLGLKSQAKISKAIEITNQQLKSELDIDISDLISFSNKELKIWVDKKRFTDEHLEIIAQYLIEIASEGSFNSSTTLNKALQIVEIIDEKSNNITFSRIQLKEKIKNSIKPLS